MIRSEQALALIPGTTGSRVIEAGGSEVPEASSVPQNLRPNCAKFDLVSKKEKEEEKERIKNRKENSLYSTAVTMSERDRNVFLDPVMIVIILRLRQPDQVLREYP